MSNSGLNCCRDWKKVKSDGRHCRVISVIAGKCVDEGCTWNMDRANGRCLYEGRSVKNNKNGMRRIYLPDGYVEGKTEMDAITLACPKCDITDKCNADMNKTDRCIYEGRSVKGSNAWDTSPVYMIYLPSGPVVGRTELEAITFACPTCDIGKTCDRLPDVVARAKGVKNA